HSATCWSGTGTTRSSAAASAPGSPGNGCAASPAAGYPGHDQAPPPRTALRRQIPIAGAQCGNPARWDLRGGPPARAVPTATLSRLGTPGGRLGGALAFLESLAVFGHDDFGELLDRSIRAALVQGDPPALKQVHPVADVEDLAVVVRDDDDRHAA